MTSYGWIPAVTVARAIADCGGRVMTDRLLDAVDDAARRGLVRRTEAEHLRAELAGVAGS